MSAWTCRPLPARPRKRLFHLVLESHDGRAYVPISERSTSPRVTSHTVRVDSLKALDPKRPIREADIGRRYGLDGSVAFDPQRTCISVTAVERQSRGAPVGSVE